MERQKNIGLLLAGVILGLCTAAALEPVYSKDSAGTEQEITGETADIEVKNNKAEEQSSEEIKVNKDTLGKASELMSQKNFAGALPYLNAYIEAKPKKYQGYKLRGEAYYALRRYSEAVSDFQRAADIKTGDDKFATGTKVISAVVLGADKQEQYQNPELGILYGELMYAQKAVNDSMYEVSYKKAMEYNSHQYLPEPKKSEIPKINCPQKYGKVFNPQGIDADIYAVIDDIEKGKYSEAVYKLPQITSEYPNYYLGYYLTGVVMSGMEQEKEAVSAFNRAISLNPYDFESYASLGLLYYREAEKTFDTKYSDLSVENFKKAISFNPNCNTYYYYIGLNDMIESDYAGAVENFKKAINLKNNDYNSRYYMAVAQYLNGNYEDTIEEAANLIYRRVSNYNSVLYLRALAYYKMKNYESAIADIEKIHHNMDDIYNADVKKLSAKEQSLESYLYYLQSRIARDNGNGAKSDLENAYQNPVIALLDKRSSDFGHANYKMTSFDIDSQYDYLRTTFDNLGIGFEYLNPDYKIVQKKTQAPVISEAGPAVQVVRNTTDGTEVSAETEEISAPDRMLIIPDTSEKLFTDNTVESLVQEQTESDGIAKSAEDRLAAAETAAVPAIPELTATEKAAAVQAEPLPETEILSEQVKKEISETAKVLTEPDTAGTVTKPDDTAEEIIKTEDIIAQKNSSGAVVEVEEIPAPETNTIGGDTETPVTLDIPQETLKQKITEKYGEKAVAAPAKTDLTPAKKTKPAVMVFDPDTLIFAQEEEDNQTGNALSADNSEKIKTLLDAENNINDILETTAAVTSEKTITEDVREEISKPAAETVEQQPAAEQKLSEIMEKTEAEDIKPVTEITEKNRTWEVSEPVLPELRGNSAVVGKSKEEIKQAAETENREVIPEIEQKINQAKDNPDIITEIEPPKDTKQNETIETTGFEPQKNILAEDNIIPENVENTAKDEIKSVKKEQEETFSALQDEEPAVKNYVEDVSKTSKSLKVPVHEKYANVNLDEFDVKNKLKPEVKDDDEIIFLDTASDSFMQRAEKQMSENYEEIMQTAAKTEETVETVSDNTKAKDKTSADEAVSEAVKNQEPADVNITKNSDSLNDTAEKEPEPELIEVHDIIISKNTAGNETETVTEEKKSADTENPAELNNENFAVNDALLPEIRSTQDAAENSAEITTGTDEISAVTDDDINKSAKTKKSKQKTDDNLVLAVGGNAEKYMNKTDKLQKNKKEKTTGETVSSAQTQDLTEPQEAVSADTNIVKDDDNQNQNEVEKPKKESFFKRLFSRKKVKTEKAESAAVSPQADEAVEITEE